MTDARPLDPTAGPCFEDAEDALLEGDRPFVAGTARAAFSHRTFRTIYLGALASNVGTWMQNVVLASLAYDLTRSAQFVGLIGLAQLAPLLILSPVGGMLADTVDRKKLLIGLTLEQAAFSGLLALAATSKDPSHAGLVAITLAIGIGNALYAPVFSALLPALVPREDIGGAVSLNSVQMNASRVVGPIIGAMLYQHYGASWAFLANALSYVAVIAVLLRVRLPDPPDSGGQGLHRLVEGFRIARRSRVLRQTLVVLSVFSLFSLPFITQMKTISARHLDIVQKSAAFGWLYAAFGLGAVVGAFSIGTVFAHASKPRIVRTGLVAFAGLLILFGTLRSAPPAFPTIFVLGCVYFAVITSLSTILQSDLDDASRGKVMALWIMGFGGLVPFGGYAGGWVIDHFSIEVMVIIGGVVAAGLAGLFDYRPDPSEAAAEVDAGVSA